MFQTKCVYISSFNRPSGSINSALVQIVKPAKNNLSKPVPPQLYPVAGSGENRRRGWSAN